MTDACVIDASVAVGILVASQSTNALDAFALSLPKTLRAPQVFRFEVRHALLRLERRRLLPVQTVDARLAVLEQEVFFDHPPLEETLAGLTRLARIRSLSIFDAAYIQLAIDRQAALASRDQKQVSAAKSLGVPTYDLS